MKSPVKIPDCPFLQVFLNQILESQMKNYSFRLMCNSNDVRMVVSNEITRTFRSLFTQGEKNQEMQTMVSEALHAAMLEIETMSPAEASTVIAICHEAAPRTFTSGTPCRNKKGQSLIYLGGFDTR